MGGPILHCICSPKGAWVDPAFSTLAHWWMVSAAVCQNNTLAGVMSVTDVFTDDLRVRCCQDSSRSGYGYPGDLICKMMALELLRLQVPVDHELASPEHLLPRLR